MVGSLAFVTNENLDKLLLGNLLGKEQMGIYAACYKLGVFMMLYIMAFRLGAEPFFFNQASKKNAKETYAKILTWFTVLGAFFMLKHYSGRYPKIFEGINIKDMQRVSRAISVYSTTGITLSDWQKKKNKKYFEKNEFIKICLLPPKQELEKRIARRFLEMLKNGAIKEVSRYRELGLSMYSLYTANKIIGLEQIGSFIDKKISMKELKEGVLIKTRQYAKRQYTWQRGQMKDWKGFSDTNYLDLRKKILSYLSKT